MKNQEIQPEIQKQPQDSIHEGISGYELFEVGDKEKIKGGSHVIDLDNVPPLLNADELYGKTGMSADLVTVVQAGNDTLIGVLDKRNKGNEPSTENSLIWSGNLNGTDELHGIRSTSEMYIVELVKDPETQKFDIKRRSNDLPIFKPLKPNEPINVGRAESNDISAPESKTLSKNHLQIVYDDKASQLVITDKGSTNGSYITSNRSQESISTAQEVDYDITIPRSELGRLVLDEVSSIKESAERKAISLESGLAELQLKGEDSSLIDSENGLFGVFDGAGGHDGGLEASRLARDVLRDAILSEDIDNMSPQQLLLLVRKSLEKTNDAVTDNPDAGITTATVLKVHEWQDRQYAVWGSVGDSRLYVYNRLKSTLGQVTDDEGSGHVLSNCIGYGIESRVSQINYFELQEGDELMLCSDGITGDTEDQLLTDSEIVGSLYYGKTAKEAADNLLRISRKPDDKTCIVVR